MRRIEYPIFKYKKRNQLRLVFFGIIFLFSILFFFGWLLSLFFKAIVGIPILGIIMLILFFLFEKYLSSYKKIGNLIFDDKIMKVQIKEEEYVDSFEDITEVNCYYFYSNNRFGQYHELQKIIDINIKSKNINVDILCPVLMEKANLIEELKKIPVQLNLISKKRR